MPGSAYFLLNGTDASLFGSSISSAGNFDAASSGISEFILGSAGDGSVGATILTGFDSGVGTGILADGSNLARITFETSVFGDQAGFEVIGGVDVNGDSIDDVALLSDSALYVIYGGVTALNSNLTEADLSFSDFEQCYDYLAESPFGQQAAVFAKDVEACAPLFRGAILLLLRPLLMKRLPLSTIRSRQRERRLLRR